MAQCSEENRVSSRVLEETDRSAPSSSSTTARDDSGRTNATYSSLVRIDSRHLRGELFPRIACAFINKRSGAKLGSAFLNVLNDLEDVHCHVHNLDEEDPDELIGKYMDSWVTTSSSSSLRTASGDTRQNNGRSEGQENDFAQFQVALPLPSVPVIMACGGDGTFSWMASTALKHAHRVMSNDKDKKKKKKQQDLTNETEASEKKTLGDQTTIPPSSSSTLSLPPKVSYCVIPFPLGTGNDMSGVLGWGRSLSANPVATKRIIDSVELSSPGPKCDVWGVKYQNFRSMSRFNTMCNYFSIGADAKASRLFENHRTSRPKLYRSQSFNKASYAAFGGFLALKGSSSLGKRIKCLLVDGEEITVPPNAKALVVLNIPSYADGTKPWNVGKNHPKFKEAAIDDGMVEIFCLKSILSIALLKILRGVFSGGVKRLAQGKSISIQMHPMEVWASKKQGNPNGNLYGQVDGESFEFQCDNEVIEIYRKGSVPTMFGPYRGKAQQGPPAKLKSGSFNARWPRSPSEECLSKETP